MKLIFLRKPFEEDCESIARILYQEEGGRAQKHLAEAFHLDLERLYRDGCHKSQDYIRKVLLAEYEKSGSEVADLLQRIPKKWKAVSNEVFSALDSIFQSPFSEDQTFHVYFTINALAPYNLATFSFDAIYRKSDDEILSGCIHELIHFFWFSKWAKIFPHTNTKSTQGNLPWLFSEIAVDAVFKETALAKFCLTDKPAYKYFYDISFDGQNMMEAFKMLFQQNNIDNFMRSGIDYLKKHQKDLPS